MDRNDLAILREMTRDHRIVWGGLDPRVSTSDIADRVDLHPSTVRTRLREWEESGFLRGHEVMPHPRLLDAQLMVTSVRMETPAEKPAFFEDLGLLEGVAAAMDHVGAWVGLVFHVEHEDALPRRVELLERLPGVGGVEEPFPARWPRPKANPSHLDWRIVRALRRDPTDTLASIADRVGVTAKTLRRRYDDLVQGQAIASVAVLDFRRYVGAAAVRVNVFLAEDGDRRAVRDQLRETYPEAVEINPLPPETPEASPSRHDRVVEFLVHLPSAALADELVATADGLPGVAEAEALFPVRYHRYPEWIDERVDRLVEGDDPVGDG